MQPEKYKHAKNLSLCNSTVKNTALTDILQQRDSLKSEQLSLTVPAPEGSNLALFNPVTFSH